MSQTALIGWELGGGLGHANRCLCLARGLAACGVRPVLAFRNLAEPWPLLRDCPFPLFQAPLASTPTGRPFLARSYADVLAVSGFADAGALSATLRGWQAIIDAVRPGLVVCDHAPALCLAAYATLPTLVIGNGFTVPPATGDAFPPLVAGVSAVAPDARLLEVVRAARGDRPTPETLPGLFGRADSLVTVHPEIDPYLDLRERPPVGPLQESPPSLPPPPRPGVFAYLAAGVEWVEPTLCALARVAPVRGYLRGASADLRQRLAQAGVEVVSELVPIAEALAGASVVVHHGSVGTVEAALAAGRPQLSMPMHLEQSITAHLLERHGVGRTADGRAGPESAAALLRELFTPGCVERARLVAERVARRNPGGSLALVVRRCRELLGG